MKKIEYCSSGHKMTLQKYSSFYQYICPICNEKGHKIKKKMYRY